MSYLTINGQRIISGSLTMPYVGAWVADVVLAVSSTLATAVTVVLGNLTLAGTVVRAAAFAGARSARVVGGAGGWRKSVLARQYANTNGVLLSMVLQDVASDVGESLRIAPGTDRSLGQFFTRQAGIAQTLLRQIGPPVWWLDNNGTTQVGTPRAGAAIGTPFQVIKYSGGRGAFEIATEDMQSWQPGASFTAPTVTTPTTISVVTHRFDNRGGVRTEVLST